MPQSDRADEEGGRNPGESWWVHSADHLFIGWIPRFLNRHGMRFRLKKRDDGSVDPIVVRKRRAKLNDLASLNDPDNVFNMDEECYATTEH